MACCGNLPVSDSRPLQRSFSCTGANLPLPKISSQLLNSIGNGERAWARWCCWHWCVPGQFIGDDAGGGDDTSQSDDAIFCLEQLTLIRRQPERNSAIFSRSIGSGEGATQKESVLGNDNATLHPTALECCINGLESFHRLPNRCRIYGAKVAENTRTAQELQTEQNPVKQGPDTKKPSQLTGLSETERVGFEPTEALTSLVFKTNTVRAGLKSWQWFWSHNALEREVSCRKVAESHPSPPVAETVNAPVSPRLLTQTPVTSTERTAAYVLTVWLPTGRSLSAVTV